jgi:hypothetical protein
VEGIGYEGIWRDVGQLSVGVQKSYYERTVYAPGAAPISGKSEPWLYYLAAAVNSVRLPAVTTIDAGLRYDLQVLGRDATVRLQLFNLTNEFSLTPNASGQLTPLDARRFDLSFAFDL